MISRFQVGNLVIRTIIHYFGESNMGFEEKEEQNAFPIKIISVLIHSKSKSPVEKPSLDPTGMELHHSP